MKKKNLLLFLGSLLLFNFSISILAANSCEKYSGEARNVCIATDKNQTDFYKKYSMQANNPTQNQLTASCANLSNAEKETCLTKNAFINKYTLTKPPTTPPTLSSPARQENTTVPPTTTTNGQQPQEAKQPILINEENNNAAESTTINEQPTKGPGKINIFNN